MTRVKQKKFSYLLCHFELTSVVILLKAGTCHRHQRLSGPHTLTRCWTSLCHKVHVTPEFAHRMGCYGYRENGVLLELHTLPHCKMHRFLVVGLEKVVFREENCQGNQNYEPIQLNTLLERLYAEIKNKHS